MAGGCLDRRFDPYEAVAELKSSLDGENDNSVHAALRRDFPEIYLGMYERSKIKKEKKDRFRSKPDSLHINWSSEQKTFVATVPECPGIEANWKNWDDAFYAIKSVHRMHEYIQRLDRLVEKTVVGGTAH